MIEESTRLVMAIATLVIALLSASVVSESSDSSGGCSSSKLVQKFPSDHLMPDFEPLLSQLPCKSFGPPFGVKSIQIVYYLASLFSSAVTTS